MTLRSSRPIILLMPDRINCNNSGYEFWSFFKNQKGLSFHSAHFIQSLAPFNAIHYVSASLHHREVSACLRRSGRRNSCWFKLCCCKTENYQSWDITSQSCKAFHSHTILHASQCASYSFHPVDFHCLFPSPHLVSDDFLTTPFWFCVLFSVSLNLNSLCRSTMFPQCPGFLFWLMPLC